VRPDRAAPAAGTVRAFLALEVDEGARSRIAGLVERLRPGLPGVRFVDPANLHLTFRFLGDSTPAALERFWDAVEAAARGLAATRAPLGDLGVFPERGAPRVLWLDLPLPPALRELQHESERAAVRAGFPPEARGFRSHLTLGRWRAPAARPALPGAQLGEAELQRLTLFRSDLRPQGALYSPLRSLELPRSDQERPRPV
jgi:RNA 2',3'-cyclic 3'-phosphodiesterase